MREFLVCFVFSVSLAWGQNVHSQINFNEGGNDFVRICDSPTVASEVLTACVVYVEGVKDGANLSWEAIKNAGGLKPGAPASLICTPEGVTRQQGANVVIQFIKQHPARAHEQTRVLVFDALADAFPCPASQ